MLKHEQLIREYLARNLKVAVKFLVLFKSEFTKSDAVTKRKISFYHISQRKSLYFTA